MEERQRSEPQPDRSVSRSAKHQTAVSETTANLPEQTRSEARATAVTPAFPSRRAPFQTPLRVPGASVTPVIAHITQEVCVTSSYGTTTLPSLRSSLFYLLLLFPALRVHYPLPSPVGMSTMCEPVAETSHLCAPANRKKGDKLGKQLNLGI